MQLIYRGIPYQKTSQDLINQGIEGKYRGKIWQKKPLNAPLEEQCFYCLTYRGANYFSAVYK